MFGTVHHPVKHPFKTSPIWLPFVKWKQSGYTKPGVGVVIGSILFPGMGPNGLVPLGIRLKLICVLNHEFHFISYSSIPLGQKLHN
jgi:hypothetical protein